MTGTDKAGPGRNDPRPGLKRGRRGFMFLELTAAVLLFGVALVAITQLLGWVGAEQRAAQRRRWACQEAENVVERLTALPPESLTPPQLGELRLGSERVEEALPSGRLEVDVTDQPGPPAAKRIRVLIRWKDRTGHDVTPVRLTAWTYPESREDR
jgi:hypothetical protein